MHPISALLPFLLLFIGLPLVEIYILIEVGRVIGALPTIGLCILTAIIGVGLLRWQGLSTFARAQHSLARGQVPALEMFEGVALGIGGGLLLTPGFATDFVGFLCLLPWTRRAMVRFILRRLQAGYPPDGPGPQPPRRGQTLEGDFRREE